jgi:ribosomal protein S18 acetylase RimI-like enzyme
MLATRQTTEEDAALITAHRRAMFASMRFSRDEILDAMSRSFEPWVRKMIAAGKYLGWVAEQDGRAAASAGLLILDWPPHPFDPAGEQRGYILNVFVEPEFRRQGLARRLTQLCVDEAQRRGIRVVVLHASDAGRPVYEGMGFRASNEMMFAEP